MSWMKRRTPTATPSPGLQTPPPPVQMYNPNQHSNSQDWQQQPANSWYNQPSMQAVPTMPTLNESQNSQVPQPNSYWQQQSYSAQPNQHQQQQQQQHQQYQYGNHGSNAMSQNNYYQQVQPTQTPQATSYEYNNVQYHGYQSYAQLTSQYDQGAPPVQSAHPQQRVQQSAQQQSDGWNNAWGWGDEDSNNSNNANTLHNANVANQVADSFGDESWNWNVEDNKKDAGNAQNSAHAPAEPELFPKTGGKAVPKPENLETVPLLPSLPINRRIKSEVLTPQWSIESQVSQESSDDILQTSESDKLFSRSSTISHSPVSGHQTPQEVQAGVKVEGFDVEHENREIVCNVKEEDVKPAVGVVPGLSVDNPYKRGNGAGGKQRASPGVVPGFFMPPASVNQSVNLETVPDNSEAPDFMQPVVQNDCKQVDNEIRPAAENNEVAPLNERNQYLETGQLSDENDALPPPGLSRMVPGQFGQGEANEPPPGLSRMVLGQNESAQSTASPPVGLHRMVPGESSSPEVRYDEEEASDPELRQIGGIRNPMQSRSATIGADTPPAPPTNGGDIGVERETHLDGANTLDHRDSTLNDVDTLASSVRDLTVGENTSDGRPSKSGESGRRLDTDSELDRAASPAERRRKDDRERRDKRYSPPREPRDARDSRARPERRKQRDRGYDDDTDYFSDKEHRRRRDERDRTEGRREDAEKKYSSLRRGERDRDRNSERRRRDDGDRERRSEYSRRERDRERDYYYNRYNDDYDDAHRSSRPSSRSDSMHDSYYREARGNGGERRRDRDRERDGRRHRDPYNMYKMPGYPYDAYNPYYQQYQYYLENLRRTDPAAYAELYRKYYGQTGAASSTYAQEEKTSVHSGRSSTNDDLVKERYLRQSYYGHANYSQMGGYYREPQSVSSTHYGLDESRPYDYTDSSMLLEDATAAQRLTPAKFSTAHVKSSIASGRLLKILPHYPMDGQAALVELERLQDLLRADDEFVELEQFPGPLARGVTHKKTIIEYCNNKIRGIQAGMLEGGAHIDDPESYILMWELLILLIRQNGMVVGADIAELLMKDRSSEAIAPRPASVASNSSGIVEVPESSIPPDANAFAAGAPASPALKEEYVTRKFREFLLYGSVQQALEWAMKNSLWGHALFLASKLDKRTYAKVMTRFANGLPMNDPLQTLYQLLSGHLPAAVTSVSDEKWGDWRPHLAMILSNTMQRPELDRKAITTLGDTLMGRGGLYAAQFCYLMAEVGFSRYGQPDAKLVLLGGDQRKPFLQCAHNEAIHMTEIYEYACSLNDASFKIPQFQAYKYLLATRLADRGCLETALAYVEQASIALVANPTEAQPSLINRVCDLADRLKYYDPADYQDADDAGHGQERPEQSWLQDLKAVQQQYALGLISHESVNNLATITPDAVQGQAQAGYDHSPPDPWAGTNQAQYGDAQYKPQAPTQIWQSHVADADCSQQTQQDGHLDSYNAYQDQTWNNQPQPQWSPDCMQQQAQMDSNQMHQQPAANDYWNNAQAEPEDAAANDDPDQQPVPQISMPNQGRQARISEPSDDGQGRAQGVEATKPKEVEKKPAVAASSSTGWFGGIFSKFALKPKNQMKLPDDKNPTIVWDQEKKRWINLEEDNADGATELKPPPKMVDMMPVQSAQQQPLQMQQQQQSVLSANQFGGTPALPTSQPQSLDPAAQPRSDAKPPLPSQNMFKMQRGRNLKKSYVDVFNPSGKAPGPGTSADFTPPAMPASNAAPVNFFVPAPMDANAPVDFLTPSGVPQQDPSVQHQS